MGKAKKDFKLVMPTKKILVRRKDYDLKIKIDNKLRLALYENNLIHSPKNKKNLACLVHMLRYQEGCIDQDATNKSLYDDCGKKLYDYEKDHPQCFKNLIDLTKFMPISLDNHQKNVATERKNGNNNHPRMKKNYNERTDEFCLESLEQLEIIFLANKEGQEHEIEQEIVKINKLRLEIKQKL